MSNDITFMDCWGFIAPLLPVSTDFERGVYVMVFHALLEVLAVFLVLVIILLVCLYLNAHYRLWLIRATLHSPIPQWLKSVLWGWW